MHISFRLFVSPLPNAVDCHRVRTASIRAGIQSSSEQCTLTVDGVGTEGSELSYDLRCSTFHSYDRARMHVV